MKNKLLSFFCYLKFIISIQIWAKQDRMDKYKTKIARDDKVIRGQNEGSWKLIQLNQANFVDKESLKVWEASVNIPLSILKA